MIHKSSLSKALTYLLRSDAVNTQTTKFTCILAIKNSHRTMCWTYNPQIKIFCDQNPREKNYYRQKILFVYHKCDGTLLFQYVHKCRAYSRVSEVNGRK